MSFWPVPDIMKNDIYELTPGDFIRRGVKLVILDVDNTISPYSVDEAPARLIEWAHLMKSAGLELFILSNNRGKRPEIFAEALGIGYVGRAAKPFNAKLRQVLEKKGVKAEETALVGDQVYTDILCAKSVGALAVAVEPIEFTHFILKFRYWLEKPFRYLHTKRRK